MVWTGTGTYTSVPSFEALLVAAAAEKSNVSFSDIRTLKFSDSKCSP